MPQNAKPKILMIDVELNAEEQSKFEKFNVTFGTFGRPYQVHAVEGYTPVIVNPSLPNHKEQEIVVVDLGYSAPDEYPSAEKHFPDGSVDIWVESHYGYVDPRPRAMMAVARDFDRILNSGGVFVVFAGKKAEQRFFYGRAKGIRFLDIERSVDVSNWMFLSALNSLDCFDDHGNEMHCVATAGSLAKLIATNLPGGCYPCSFRPPQHLREGWLTLVQNKFGNIIGAATKSKTGGILLILPQVADKSQFLLKLLTEVLPELTPELFPEISNGTWTRRPEYELSNILALQEQRRAIETAFRQRITEIEEQIEREREAQGWMHHLLTGTDDVLVNSVVRALQFLGFNDVRDIDQVHDQQSKQRREDLQIHDSRPTLVVDIKGLGGHAADSDAFQSYKHATLRQKEWERFDVQALTIINHQRHLPPLERDNQMPFRQEILDYATEVKMGIITAFDLYRLVRNAMKLSWDAAVTKPVLYRIERISPIPVHYAFLGTIAHVYSEAVSIAIADGEVRIGDRVSYELGLEFEEEAVSSLQVNKQQVEVAGGGTTVGVGSRLGRSKLRVGMPVYVIRKGQTIC